MTTPGDVAELEGSVYAGGTILRSFPGGENTATAEYGVPTDTQLRFINERIAREAVTAESVFAFPIEMSNTELDSHLTWFDRSSLELFARGVNGQGGLPLFRNHATGSMFSAPEDPHGRLFLAELVEGGPEPVRDSTEPLFAREHFNRAGGALLRLIEWAFMVRDAAPNGYANRELITGISSGAHGAASVGATTHPRVAPGSDILDDVTGLSIWRDDAKLPGMEVELEGGEVVIATARITKAAQREGSLVPIGSNGSAQARWLPTAMANRASTMVANRSMGDSEARRLEALYGANILAPRIHSIPVSAGPGVGPEQQEDRMTAPTGPAPTNTPADESDALRAQLSESADHLATARSEHAALVAAVRALVGADGELALGRVLEDVGRRVGFGDAYRASLETRLVEAHTRVNLTQPGQDSFDRAAFLARFERWTPEQLEGELAMYGGLAERLLSAGLTSGGNPAPVRQGGQHPAATMPAQPASLFRG